jgi:hypothetical protein
MMGDPANIIQQSFEGERKTKYSETIMQNLTTLSLNLKGLHDK